MRVKVSGPTVKRVTRALYLAENPSNLHASDDDVPSNGDLYFHIRLSWKALTAIGLIVAQSVVTLIRDQFHLFT
jgi:hypothetical protein